MIEKFREYANAFEMAVQDEDTEDAVGGWSDIVKKDVKLLEQVRKMVKNRDNAEGRKIAVLHCKHKKESIRYLADKVMQRIPFEVEDRTSIEL